MAVLFQHCTNKVICYDNERCSKKYNVCLSIKNKDLDSFSVVLENKSNLKIHATDSFKLRFYKYNINLKQKNYDSALLNMPDITSITGVLYEQPINFFSVNFKNDIINKSINRYEFKVPIDSLINAIDNFGNADNKLQIKNQFQVFMVGFRNNIMICHIPSSFFKID